MKTIRLFQITQLLRHHRQITARQLAEQLEVSQRTIYRDIQHLQLSGVPINGEAGSGYWLEQSFDFPPLMFTEREVAALAFGMRLAMQTADRDLSNAARTVLDKVNDALPGPLRQELAASPLDMPFPTLNELQQQHFHQLRLAIRQKQKVQLHYQDEQQRSSDRKVRPLELSFWGKVWTVTSWCEKREDFRNFRIDRIECLKLLPQHFIDEPGRRLADYHQQLLEQDAHAQFANKLESQ